MTTNTEYNNKFKSHLDEGGSKAWKYCGMSGGPWCCAEVSLVAGETNKKLFYGGRKCTYCPTAMAYDKAHYARVPMYLAMSGDRIYYDWNGNGIPDHIGEVDYRISTEKIATVEGNTGSPARVRKRERPAKYVLGIYRPEYQPATMPKKEKLSVDGAFEFKSIYMLQIALNVKPDCILGKGTVKALQKKVGVVPDGDWGAKTSKAVQKMVGAKVDGAFGKNSVMALQKWINTNAFPSVGGGTTTAPKPATTTNAQKIVNKVNELAWPYGTASSKWDYKKGSPTAKCKAAMKAFGYTSKSKMSSCIYAVNTVVRSTGINKSFCAGHGYKKPYPKTEAGFNTVLSGKAVPSGFLQPGDIVRYKKTTKDEHSLIYIGNGRIAEARHYHRFFNIYKDEKRYNGSNVKKSTLQVLRAK